MAPVYSEITIQWNGTEYRLTPTFALIQKIEQRISLAGLLNRTIEGNPPLSQLADLIATCLQVAGCRDRDATAESINAELYSAENAQALTVAATDVLLALLPQRATRGNALAPEKGAELSGISTGPSTTRSPLATSGSSPRSSGR